MSEDIMFVGGPGDGWHKVANLQRAITMRAWIEGAALFAPKVFVDHIYTRECYRLPPDEFTDPRNVFVYVHSSLTLDQALPLIERRLGI